MKKSIAFLGALLFGSVTFGQVTKNDSIKKPSARKVSTDDLKKFPVDAETTIHTGGIKGETLEKHKGEQTDIGKSNMYLKYERTEKHASDASAGAGASSEVKGTVTQKGRSKDGIIITEKLGGVSKATTTEKQHYTVKLTNANKKADADGTEPIVIKEGSATTQKKHVSNIKWTPGKVAKDSLPTPGAKSSDIFLKIGDIKGEKDDK